MAFTAHPLAIRIGSWIARRHGPERGEVSLGQRRVYILPTRAGLIFAAVMLIMLIASINYGLQMGYVLTFLVASMAVVGMYHTHRNLSRITLRGTQATDTFAGDLAGFALVANNPTAETRFALSFSLMFARRRRSDYEDGELRPLPGETIDLPAQGQRVVSLGLPTRRRGLRPCPRIRVQTHFPLGLWVAWAYFLPDLEAVVYPKPEAQAPALPASQGGSQTDNNAMAQGGDDLAGVRPYQSGDPQQRIAWRLAARCDELSVKMFDAPSGGDWMLTWEATAMLADAEQRLSRLTRWVLDADAAHLRYGLAIPGTHIDLGRGAAHRARCLRALALARV